MENNNTLNLEGGATNDAISGTGTTNVTADLANGYSELLDALSQEIAIDLTKK